MYHCDKKKLVQLKSPRLLYNIFTQSFLSTWKLNVTFFYLKSQSRNFEKMPLTSQQKSIIFTRLRDGVSMRDIADELNINIKTVLLAKSKIREHGSIVRNPGSGRPKVSTNDEDTALINYLRNNPFKTAIRAREETDFPGSSITARRRIRRSELRNRCSANKIYLTELNKQRRVQFANEYQNQLWESVVFSDEKTFQSCNNGRVRVYRPINTRYDERYTNKTNQSGRFSVNVWGWMSARGPGVCQVIEGRLTALTYRNLLSNVMVPSVGAIFGQNYIFQQDNAPVHTARIVTDYFQENNIQVLPWPSKSPDFNPMENVWGEMTKFMYKHDFHPRNEEELRQGINAAWDTITQEYTRSLVLSMPRRLQKAIENNGAMTKY